MPASTQHPSTLRSSTGMSGLVQAETGGAMVQLDRLGGGSGFREGYTIDPGALSLVSDYPDAASTIRPPGILGYPPHKTPLSASAPSPTQITLKQSCSRLELDLALESNIVVEGGRLRGWLQVKVPKPGKHDSVLLIAGAKLRVIGFEALFDDSHTFYQHAQPLELISSATHLYCSGTDDQGFREACVGTHTIPFVLPLPVGGGAKGPLMGSSPASVRYIVLASVKIRNAAAQSRSIAHFYRVSSSSKTLFLGGKGKLELSCALHRGTWVAGQHCWVKINIHNDTSKRVKTLSLALIRTTTVFRSLPHLDPGTAHEADSIDIDACQTSTNRKQVAESVLDSGQRGSKGLITGKGWWMGVNAGDYSDLKHSILIPPDALSIGRSRLVEVAYALRITATAGSLSSDVSVDLPITVISFLSIDPPPNFDLISTFLPSVPLNSPTEAHPPASPHFQEIHRTVASGLPQIRKAVSFSEAVFETQADLRKNIHDSAQLDQAPLRTTYRPRIELALDFQPQSYRGKIFDAGAKGQSFLCLLSLRSGGSDIPPKSEINLPSLQMNLTSDNLGENTALRQTTEYAGGSDDEVEYIVGSCQPDRNVEQDSMQFKDRRPRRTERNIPSPPKGKQLQETTRLPSHKTHDQVDRTRPRPESIAASRPPVSSLPLQQSDHLPEIYRTDLGLSRWRGKSGTQPMPRNLPSRPRAKSMLDMRSSADPMEPIAGPITPLYASQTDDVNLESGLSRLSLDDPFPRGAAPLSEHPGPSSRSMNRISQFPYLQAPPDPVHGSRAVPSLSSGSVLPIASSVETISPSVYSSSASSPSLASLPTSNTERSSCAKVGISSVKARIALLEEKSRTMISGAATPGTVPDRSSIILNPKLAALAPSVRNSRDTSTLPDDQAQLPTINGRRQLSKNDEKDSADNGHTAETKLSREDLSGADHAVVMETRSMRDVHHPEDGKQSSKHIVGLGLISVDDQKQRNRLLPAVHRR
ncbi:hypothetical protein BS47DRAFT_1391918 [Hydnum rufescens UP504]|uniref:Arrestin C-terminal-like domain-containing protein n=1 Tax=Hydnum rufescens UP504 TaxID=1448309 RepID=A0A9P6B0A5_9AGAM|nr:hypothetical protein BS47DRAFT_1391918 [Hydnum rufescens UP504]